MSRTQKLAEKLAELRRFNTPTRREEECPHCKEIAVLTYRGVCAKCNAMYIRADIEEERYERSNS